MILVRFQTKSALMYLKAPFFSDLKDSLSVERTRQPNVAFVKKVLQCVIFDFVLIKLVFSNKLAERLKSNPLRYLLIQHLTLRVQCALTCIRLSC